MSQFFVIHPDNPQPRLVREAAKVIREGGIVVYRRMRAYAIGCRLGDREAQDRIRELRDLSEAHYFTLVCRIFLNWEPMRWWTMPLSGS